MLKFAELGPKIAFLWRKEIWATAHLNDNSPRGWAYAVLRVLSITGTAFQESKIPSRAAALSFSSLLGLGPLIAIAVLIGSFVLGNENDKDGLFIANKIGELVETVAPQLRQLDSLNATEHQPGVSVSPEVVSLIKGIITGARSGSASALGAFSLTLIVLLLFKSIEDAFNDIWGVRLGRSLLMRIVFYWTILTLGAVLFFAAVALLGASAVVNVFMEKLPLGHEMLIGLSWALPVFSLLLIVGLLTLVYRVIPNTHVSWRAAFIGAVVVAALLMFNNYVALLYVRRVVLERSLYGSLGILPVLMLGLYIFWLYVLIGGVLSYGVQNVHFRNSQAAWGSLTESMRERLTLVVLLTICRRFKDCLPPASSTELSTLVKVPTQVLNECLNRLVAMKLVLTVRPATGTPAADFLYQPARPLNRINLYEFKTLDDNLGDDPIGHALERIDPLMLHYAKTLDLLGEQEFFKKSLEELFNDHPFDESRPPFKTLKPAR